MIPVSCPNCGFGFDAPDESAGKAYRCQKCGKSVQVPGVPVPPGGAAPVAVGAPVAVAPAGGGAGGMAIAGMVLGIPALAISFIPCIGWIAFLPAVTGLVLSIVALATAKKAGRSKGAAVAGLVCSTIAIIWIPIYIAVIVGSAMHAVHTLR